MKPLWILVADDSEAIQGLLWHWLTKSGHCVACAGSGDEALKLLSQHSFDLLIADYRMPNGGNELIETFRQVVPSGRILGISGSARGLTNTGITRISGRRCADAILGKPFTREQLLNAVSCATTAQVPSDAESA